jgi:hypothetical protein
MRPWKIQDIMLQDAQKQRLRPVQVFWPKQHWAEPKDRPPEKKMGLNAQE